MNIQTYVKLHFFNTDVESETDTDGCERYVMLMLLCIIIFLHVDLAMACKYMYASMDEHFSWRKFMH